MADDQPVPGIATGSLGTLAESMARLSTAMEQNPEHVDVPTHSKAIDKVAKQLLEVCGMIEHRSLKNQVASGAGKVPDEVTPDIAVKHSVGYKSISPQGVMNLYSRFKQLDTDETGRLSIPELTRCAILSLAAARRTPIVRADCRAIPLVPDRVRRPPSS